ncbi:hypothetical protein D3C78_876910 [compost metagenome]
MVEHVAIVDADRHEVKHASTAANNQVLHANGDGTTSFEFVDYGNLVNIPTPVGYKQILLGYSTAAVQNPAGLDTALQVEFGPGAVTADATLAPTGVLTFHTEGDYYLTLLLRFGRTAGPGTSVLFNRFLINGVQGLNSNGLKLPDADSVIPFSAGLVIPATAGMTFSMQIMRDSGGINNGGLHRILPTVLPWNLVPSATIVVSKFIGEI